MSQAKSYTAFAIKATDDERRTFTGLASTWDQDLGGDVIERGAFKDTLAEWKQDGRVLPLLDSHNNGSVRSIVGKMLAAKETADGLEATFEVLDGPDGDEVYRRIKGGFVDGLSIGYEPKEWAKPEEEERQKGVWRILKRVNLMEVSVVLWPMNTGARIASVKAALDGAEPERLSDEDRRTLRTLAGRIGALLRPTDAKSDPVEDEPDAQEPPEEQEEKGGEEPQQEKEEEQKQDPQDPAPPPEPSADADGDDRAPEHVREALLKRVGRINGTLPTEDEDDE